MADKKPRTTVEVASVSAGGEHLPKPAINAAPTSATVAGTVDVDANKDSKDSNIFDDLTVAVDSAEVTEAAEVLEAAEALTQDPLEQGVTEKAQSESSRQTVVGWLRAISRGHEGAIAGGFAGLLVVILVYNIGFWTTLLIVLFVVAGVAVGQIFDGDPKIIRVVRAFIEEHGT